MPTKRCATCGNVIQEWMHGQCTTCQRNQQDYKRYGRRRPLSYTKISPKSVKPTRQPAPPKVSIPAQQTCPICNQKVRSDRYASHMWEIHKTNPNAQKPELERKARDWQAARIEAKKKKSSKHIRKKAQPCPECGASLAPESLTPHLRRHAQRREQFQLSTLRRGINTFLNRVYKKPQLISHILRRQGLTPAEINRLREEEMACFINQLAERWARLFRALLPPRLRDIIICSFGLDGAPPLSLTTLSREYKKSEAFLRLRAAAAVVQLQKPANRLRIEEAVIQAAEDCLLHRPDRSS